MNTNEDRDSAIDEIAQKVRQQQRITSAEAILLYNDAPLSLLSALATEAKRAKSDDRVFYNRNFHLEPTNVCLFNCKFCSYRRTAGAPDAWDFSIEEMLEIVEKRKNEKVTEVHVVGGVHPNHDLEFYLQLIRGIKAIMPHVVVKAFTAIELDYMIKKSGLTLEQGLRALKEAGMQAIPGGGAEIFNDRVRSKICAEKGSAELWLQIHKMAHELGISTNATILYGHIESIEDRIDHLQRLRDLQDQTGGFNAFIPLKYRNMHNSMSEIGEVSIVDDMRTMAISRIFLDNFPHIKAYWPMFGKQTTEMALVFGADDIDGTIDDSTKIYSMAGAEDEKPSMSTDQMREMVKNGGFVAVERDTFYNEI